MKKTLFFIVLIILGVNTIYSQNYQTIYPGRTALYSSNGNVFPVYTTEEKRGDQLVYHLNKVIDFNDTGRHGCGSGDAPCWAGETVFIRNDGTNVYFNKNNEKIEIKTQCQLNEKWIAYLPADSSIVIEAEVIKVEEKTILGQPDSVKTIRFKVLENKGSIANDINLKIVSLSKNYGWIEAVNFSSFPQDYFDELNVHFYEKYLLVGIDQPQLGIQNLTTFDIFDFQPGDIIQTEESKNYAF